jgi:hypothetical protein
VFHDVSVIIPIVREDKAKRAIEAVELHCPGVEIIAEKDVNGIGCPQMVERLVAKATRQRILFLGDDTIIQAGALLHACEKMDSLPEGWGVVGLNTLPFSDKLHWLADKRMMSLIPGGQLFPTVYKHCFCDDELKDIALEHGRWVFSPESIVEHDHPVEGADSDEFYQKAYQSDNFKQDQVTYFKRKRERVGGKLAIAFPLVNESVHVNFFLSMMAMNKPDEFAILTPRNPHGLWQLNIDEARNNLVRQALADGCSHLLMCDTDQVYPRDTLNKLMAHGVDICGVIVHRRYPPFDPILLRADKRKADRYVHVGDEEMFSGDLIEVDATGTGCLLINMSVFNLVPEPWFKIDEQAGKPVGEDIYFCWKARNAGVSIHIDTSVRVGHLSTMEIDRALYEICKHMPNINT